MQFSAFSFEYKILKNNEIDQFVTICSFVKAEIISATEIIDIIFEITFLASREY